MKVWTAAELMATEFPPPTVDDLLDLIDSGQCTPQCLFGHEGAPCECRCGEQHHGIARAVRDAD